MRVAVGIEFRLRHYMIRVLLKTLGFSCIQMVNRLSVCINIEFFSAILIWSGHIILGLISSNLISTIEALLSDRCFF